MESKSHYCTQSAEVKLSKPEEPVRRRPAFEADVCEWSRVPDKEERL